MKKVNKRCGAADSKYFGNLDQFERDIEKHKRGREKLKEEIREIVLREPGHMEERIHVICEALREIKEEFDL